MPSKAYEQSVKEQAAHHARSKTFSGSLLRPHIPYILGVADDLVCKSGLDYGCGKGVQFTEPWVPDPELDADAPLFEEAIGFQFYKFDPCLPQFAAEPPRGATFDLVIVSHVLFWIPLADLREWALPRLYGYADKAIVIIETIGDEKKRILSDRDAHPRGLHAVDWIDLLLPYHHAGRAATHLISEYRAADGRIYNGKWVL